MEFGITVRSVADRTVIAVTGELDVDSADELRTALVAATQVDHTGVDIDMSGVTFMDSSGLRELIGTYKRLAVDGRQMRIVEPSERVVRLLKLTGQYERFIGADGQPS